MGGECRGSFTPSLARKGKALENRNLSGLRILNRQPATRVHAMQAPVSNRLPGLLLRGYGDI